MSNKGLEEMSQTDESLRDFIRRGETSFLRIEENIRSSQSNLDQKMTVFQSEVKSEMTEIKGDIKLLNERLGSGKDTVARVESEFGKLERELADMRLSNQSATNTLIELKTQMRIVSVVGGVLLVAVVGLVFRVFAGT